MITEFDWVFLPHDVERRVQKVGWFALDWFGWTVVLLFAWLSWAGRLGRAGGKNARMNLWSC